MQDLPHRYTVTAAAAPESYVTLSSSGLADLPTAGPPEFGGPGDVWSPETLLVGAVADCFILSFRAIARAARLDWLALDCDVVATLDKVDRVTQFTHFAVTAELVVPAGANREKAGKLMEKAEKHCLITNSLKAASTLQASIREAD